MFGPFLEALVARLCLVLGLLLGVMPAQEFVLCFEPDGTIALETVGGEPVCGAGEESGPGEEPRAETAATERECCDCTDITLGKRGEDGFLRVSTRVLHVDVPVAMAPAEWSHPLASVVGEMRLRVDAPPRPPGVLAHIRAVELRV
ncbi:hypothetical protein L6V77_03455 [Myxococcota bacterium]|nr:hypothetical protein [Myxococcota bacterium]